MPSPQTHMPRPAMSDAVLQLSLGLPILAFLPWFLGVKGEGRRRVGCAVTLSCPSHVIQCWEPEGLGREEEISDTGSCHHNVEKWSNHNSEDEEGLGTPFPPLHDSDAYHWFISRGKHCVIPVKLNMGRLWTVYITLASNTQRRCMSGQTNA